MTTNPRDDFHVKYGPEILQHLDTLLILIDLGLRPAPTLTERIKALIAAHDRIPPSTEPAHNTPHGTPWEDINEPK